MGAHRDKIQRLIEAFPWGEPDFPTRTPGHEETLLAEWIDRSALRHAGATGLALKARIDPIVRAVQRAVCLHKTQRFVARIDATHLTKSPASILEKMAREWDGITAPRIGFRDIRAAFSDLARFRIVVNFLSDAIAVRRLIEAPFGTPPPGDLSEAQVALAAEFGLHDCRFIDTVSIGVADRKSPERSFKGVFRPRSDAIGIGVEVQIQTLLQESWDKKQHVLVYEPRRRGELVEEGVERELEAMSDLLYVADSTFDRLRTELQGKA